MPIIRKPLDGFDTEIVSIVESPMGRRLKDHKRFVLSQNVPVMYINYVMKNLYGALGMNLNIRLILANDENDQRTNAITYNASQLSPNEADVAITLLNWDNKGVPDKYTDMYTDEQMIIDFGNGAGLSFNMGIVGSPASKVYTIDFYLWGILTDPDKAFETIEEDNAKMEEVPEGEDLTSNEGAPSDEVIETDKPEVFDEEKDSEDESPSVNIGGLKIQ